MKIISLAPSNTEILYRLGAGDQVIATTSLCDHPKRAVKTQNIGGWTKGIKFRKIEELDPDLVMASDDLQDKAVEKLEDPGFSILQVKPHSLEEVYESIKLIGDKIGREEKALEAVEEMQDRLEKISLEDAPRIYCEEWSEPPMVSGNWIPGLIEKIGGSYFIEDGRSREFDLEDLKRFDPEYIFLNICGAGDNANRQEVLEREDWQDITAVENRDVYVIDDALLNRPGPRLVKGSREIARIIREV